MSAKRSPGTGPRGPKQDGAGRRHFGAASGSRESTAGWSEGAKEGSAGCGHPGPREGSGREARRGPQTREPGTRATPEAVSLLPPSPASTRRREVTGSHCRSRRCGRSRSGPPRTPLLSPRGSPDARGLAASVLNPHRRVAAGKERIVERPRVTLHEGPCGGDSNRKVGVHT